MLDRTNLLSLMRTVANANPSNSYSFGGESFTYEALNETLRNELNEIVGNTLESFEQNKYQLFSLISETMDETVPNKLVNAYGMFAEIRTYGQGEKPIFTRKTGHQRAKQFITRVGIAGRYEVFELGEERFEVATSALGGAARIGFEEFLDGKVNFAELVQILTEGMQELIYNEIGRSLMDSIDQLPAANKVSVAGFIEADMDALIATVSAYGSPIIYCTREFAVKMVPQTNWISDSMRDQMWNNGHLANYKGCPVVVLPQSLVDDKNNRKIVDPGYVWVIPTGTNNDKPVKVAFEGQTQVRTVENNDDWSRDLQMYRKVGVNVIMTSNIGSYVDTSLKGHLENPYKAS